jgi:hypothetical protein
MIKLAPLYTSSSLYRMIVILGLDSSILIKDLEGHMAHF